VSRRAALAFLLLASLAVIAGAQQPPAGGPAAPAAPATERVPEPYRPEEFPAWALDLRRAEIVFFGSLPFSLALTFETWDIGRFVASGFDPLRAPWPLRAGSVIGAGYTPAEKGWLIAAAVTVSAGVSVADFLLGRRARAREDR
jgi:hypothetical protein